MTTKSDCAWTLYDEVELYGDDNNEPIDTSRAFNMINKGKYLGTCDKESGDTALYLLLEMSRNMFEDDIDLSLAELKKLILALIRTGKSNPGQFLNSYTPSILIYLLNSVAGSTNTTEQEQFVVDIAKSIVDSGESNATCADHLALFFACKTPYLEPVAIHLMIEFYIKERIKFDFSSKHMQEIRKLVKPDSKLGKLMYEQLPNRTKITENIPQIVAFRESKTAKKMPQEIRNTIIRSIAGGRHTRKQKQTRSHKK